MTLIFIAWFTFPIIVGREAQIDNQNTVFEMLIQTSIATMQETPQSLRAISSIIRVSGILYNQIISYMYPEH
jgi:hypothetical protein